MLDLIKESASDTRETIKSLKRERWKQDATVAIAAFGVGDTDGAMDLLYDIAYTDGIVEGIDRIATRIARTGHEDSNRDSAPLVCNTGVAGNQTSDDASPYSSNMKVPK